MTYETFKILIDEPSDRPGLGLDAYAAALAEVVRESTPRFAVGIFGSWGTGKSTLMRAVREAIRDDENVVAVEFNAWRYEREEDLVVPLLDTLRDEFTRLAQSSTSEATRDPARRVAGALGRAAKAILAGIALKASVPGMLEVSLDANRSVTAWADGAPTDETSEPSSFYHASFSALRRVFAEYVDSGDLPASLQHRSRKRRIVVFVDDLDRCLPSSALDVLESMKLLFDFDGFVFVVGIDATIIASAVQEKYKRTATGSEPTATPVSGAEYVKKIFQVPLSVPPMPKAAIDDYLEVVARDADLPAEQVTDMETRVAAFVSYLSGTPTVNPREVKRLINLYTLQVKILEHKLGARVDPDVVLAVNTMSLRDGWAPLFVRLVGEPDAFQGELNRALEGNAAALDTPDMSTSERDDFLEFASGPGSALQRGDVGVYTTTAAPLDERLAPAREAVREMRTVIGNLGDQRQAANRGEQLGEEWGYALERAVDTVNRAVVTLDGALADYTSHPLAGAISYRAAELAYALNDDSASETWLPDLLRRVTAIEADLVRLRLPAGTGGFAA